MEATIAELFALQQEFKTVVAVVTSAK